MYIYIYIYNFTSSKASQFLYIYLYTHIYISILYLSIYLSISIMIPCHISEVFRENVALPPNTCRNVTNTNNIKLTAAAQILCILISPTSTPLQPIPGANLSDIFAPSAVHISSKTKFQAPGLHATRDPGMLVQGDMEYPDTSPCQFLRRTVGSNFCEEIKHCRNNIKQPVCRSLLTEA